MNKRLLIAGCALAVGICRPAAAQTASYDLNLFGTNGELGSYSAKLQKWDGTANDFGKTFRLASVRSSMFPNLPIDNAVAVQICFYGHLGCVGPTLAIAGISGVAGITTVTLGTPVNPQTSNWGISAYNGHGQKYAGFFSPTNIAPDVIQTHGSNGWLEDANGRITTRVRAESASISVLGQDGHVYSGNVNLGTVARVPEASSLLLLLPGLVPVGLMLRKRQYKMKNEK